MLRRHVRCTFEQILAPNRREQYCSARERIRCSYTRFSPPTCALMATWNCKLLPSGFPQRFCNHFDNNIKERRCQALTKEHKSCLGSGLPLFTELPRASILGSSLRAMRTRQRTTLCYAERYPDYMIILVDAPHCTTRPPGFHPLQAVTRSNQYPRRSL